ncbi:2-polyprenyl-6-methoxyphenol hydroxylase [Promicromonospora umidemergens]|uniref:FAD-dependent oxidoreductase n=1 Tax=Promicromonospora umidemergens TaxID=629679 RepID=A0ABP8WYX4_9MICO|nr:FAD-dependent monooxygenase [Promicromonospora umidemergens]MCP2285763.1 2-polyprenyl-6-methoxyphenol hydroxylase [Promicromonospora umidemergens]
MGNGQQGIGNGSGHAVVVGGSIAGLLAAVVLVGHAGRVTLVERDRYPDRPEPRKGVPQSKHTHLLLESGLVAMERFLPGLGAELVASGARQVRSPTDYLQHMRGRWFSRGPATSTTLCLTRPLLEHGIRARVLAHPRIDAVQGTDVVGLAGSAERVTGVLLRERGGGRADSAPTELAADLVVDAAGRSSRTPEWLRRLGAEAPAEDRVESGMGYVTRVYRDGSDGALTDARLVYLVGETMGAVIVPVEPEGTHMITFATPRGEALPTEPAAFEALADRQPHPLVRQWLDKAEPVSPVFGYLRTENVRRAYDRVVPDGLLVTGDALCALNPVFGQGMSTAALDAVALDESLAAGLPNRRAQAALLAASAQAWAISTGADKVRPGVTGNAAHRSVRDRITGWYFARVQERCGANPEVQATFRRVLALLVPPTELFRPVIVRSVLFEKGASPDAAAPLRL